MKKITLGLSIFLLTLALMGATTVSVKTADYSVALTDDGSIIIVNSASNLSVYLPSLPLDRVGFTVTVQKRGAGNLTIRPQATAYVADSGVGQYVRNTVAGEIWASITLTYATASRWTVTAALGTWATDTSTLGTGLTVPVSVPNGGTGAATYALNGVLYGNATSAIGVTAIGAEGKILRAGASPFVPAWTTATYPATAGAAGKIMVSDGTNWVGDDVLSAVPTGLTYTTATRALSLTSGYVIPTTTEESNWGTAYTRSLSPQTIGFTLAGGTTPKTLTLDTDITASALAPKASPAFTGTVTDLQSSEADFDVNEVKATGIPAGYGMVMVAETSTKKSGIFRLEDGTISSISKDASFTITKDNASTINVYYDTDQVKVQNKITTGAIEAVAVNAAGADYLVSDILTLGDGTGGTVTVSTIGGDGHVDAFSIATPGLGYDVAVHTTTVAPAGGTGCTVDVSAVDGGDGHIDTVAVSNAGLGYAINDVLTVTGGTGSGGTLTVTAIDKGHVTGVTLTTPGSGYTAASHATTGGTGTGCTITVSAIVGLVLKIAYFGIV
jgi:hypothetical protein